MRWMCYCPFSSPCGSRGSVYFTVTHFKENRSGQCQFWQIPFLLFFLQSSPSLSGTVTIVTGVVTVHRRNHCHANNEAYFQVDYWLSICVVHMTYHCLTLLLRLFLCTVLHSELSTQLHLSHCCGKWKLSIGELSQTLAVWPELLSKCSLMQSSGII